jgi:hypothetical protein
VTSDPTIRLVAGVYVLPVKDDPPPHTAFTIPRQNVGQASFSVPVQVWPDVLEDCEIYVGDRCQQKIEWTGTVTFTRRGRHPVPGHRSGSLHLSPG